MAIYYGNSGIGPDPQFNYPDSNGFAGPVPIAPVRIDAVVLPTDHVPGQIPNTTGDNSIKWTSVPKLQGVSYGEVENGNSQTNTVIQWPLGARQSITMATDSTFIFTPPVVGITVQLKLVQDSSGGRVAVWPVNTKWAGGQSTLSVTPLSVDFATFYYDGTIYWGVLGKGFA
jgi:hypothetical protein